MPARTRRRATKAGGIEAHTVYLSNLNWHFATMQNGRHGASGYIDRLIDLQRRRGEDTLLKKQARKLRTEIARLEGIIVKMGGDPNAQ
jgi:hypothetical protein